ncbi:MAG: dihydrofolate reductase family protein [Patulibacter minatonensis]
MAGSVRVFIATSLDGFIAGEHDDLSWLPVPVEGGEDYGYAEFMQGTAALLMGRRTYDQVTAMEGGEWFYGDTPVYVATTRPLEDARPTVRAVRGDSAADLLAAVQADIGDGNVYLDGGTLIRSFLDAGLLDQVIVTVIPVVLGKGLPLFAGASFRKALELQGSQAYADGLVQLRYTVID